jgi:hypothetical protein
MSTSVDVSSTSPPTVSQVVAQRSADTYLLTQVAATLETTSPILIPGACAIWRMLVRLGHQEPSVTVGTIDVDAHTGAAVPLTAEQVEDMRDRLKEHLGEASGILRPTAQILANGYLADQVSLFAKADRPVWVAGARPVWRATVFLRLRGQGRVCDLGTLDVDAQTGAVVPLTKPQLQAMRKRAHDAAERTAVAATPAR